MTMNDKLLSINIAHLIEDEPLEGTIEERALARRFYHDNYSRFAEFRGEQWKMRPENG